MLVAAAALVVAGVLASMPRALRVRRRARALSRTMAASQDQLRALVEEQARLRGTTGSLTQPQRRLLRWLGLLPHPARASDGALTETGGRHWSP